MLYSRFFSEEESKPVEKVVQEEPTESQDTETTTPKDKQEKSQQEPDLKSTEDEEKMISSPSGSQIVVDADSIEIKSDSSAASSTSNMSNKGGQLVGKLETSQKTEDSE